MFQNTDPAQEELMKGSHMLGHFNPSPACHTPLVLALVFIPATFTNLSFAWVYPEGEPAPETRSI